MRFADKLNPYAHIMRLRRLLYDTQFLPTASTDVPVISVGNIDVGGTGKTPTVQWIARSLQSAGYRPAIVLRGYGRRSKGLVVVSSGEGSVVSVEESGDEARLHATTMTGILVVVDEKRTRGASKAAELGADVIILDDAYQHLTIGRDLNILLIDLQSGLSSVLPFGRSREPIGAVKAADLILFTNPVSASAATAEASEFVKKHQITQEYAIAKVGITRFRTLSCQAVSLNTGGTVLALSAIARPKRFHVALRELGYNVDTVALRDHAQIDAPIISSARQQARESGASAIVVTSKDAVKLNVDASVSDGVPIVVAESELVFLENETNFAARIVTAIQNFVFLDRA